MPSFLDSIRINYKATALSLQQFTSQYLFRLFFFLLLSIRSTGDPKLCTFWCRCNNKNKGIPLFYNRLLMNCERIVVPNTWKLPSIVLSRVIITFHTNNNNNNDYLSAFDWILVVVVVFATSWLPFNFHSSKMERYSRVRLRWRRSMVFEDNVNLFFFNLTNQINVVVMGCTSNRNRERER